MSKSKICGTQGWLAVVTRSFGTTVMRPPAADRCNPFPKSMKNPRGCQEAGGLETWTRGMCVLRLGHTRGGWLACRLAFLRWFAWLDPRSGSRGLGPASGLRPAHTADPATANRWIFSSCCSRRPSLVKVAPPPQVHGGLHCWDALPSWLSWSRDVTKYLKVCGHVISSESSEGHDWRGPLVPWMCVPPSEDRSGETLMSHFFPL